MSENNLTPTEEKVETTEVKTEKPAEKQKVVEVKAKDVKDKKKKEKKQPSKVAKALKDTKNELKKVTWPKFKDVCKQTGIVLAVVLIIALVLFGFDRLCSWLATLLVK